MSIYKKSFIITAILSTVSLIIGIILNYGFDEAFWCNVCLGIFGSSMLTSISSIIGYSVEKKNALEGFYFESIKIIKFINTYQADLKLVDKIDFFLDMANYDMSTWDLYFAKMDFFDNRKRKEIYETIYNPLQEVQKAANKHEWHFRMHKSGTGINEVVMQKFVDELEPKILVKEKHKHTFEGEDTFTTSIHNRVMDEVLPLLNSDKYFGLVFGKRKVEKEKRNGRKA